MRGTKQSSTHRPTADINDRSCGRRFHPSSWATARAANWQLNVCCSAYELAALTRRRRKRFIANHRLNRFKLNPYFPVNTLSTMRLAVAAQALGCGPQTIDALYAAMCEQAVNLGELDHVAAVLSEAGLDGPMLSAKAQEPEIKERLIRNTQSAHERGAFGAPSFLVGDQLFFGKDRLAEVEAEVVRLSDAE